MFHWPPCEVARHLTWRRRVDDCVCNSICKGFRPCPACTSALSMRREHLFSREACPRPGRHSLPLSLPRRCRKGIIGYASTTLPRKAGCCASINCKSNRRFLKNPVLEVSDVEFG